jgi:uncharacterized membrane protein
MTSRQGLWIALIGLIIAVACAIPAQVIPDTGTPETGGASDATMVGIFVLYIGGFVGFIVMVMGLIMAAVGALTKQTR